jgi:adenine-specific DNA-methyltransferase
MNKADGGNRKFILVEMEDYAESITAERVKRVINGYGDVEGTGGDFSYYELGEPLLLPNGNLNENVDVQKIREYVYYMETKEPLPICEDADNKYYLGRNKDTAYYFYYEKNEVTTLDHAFLATVGEKADGYIIYADLCTLSESELKEYNITFKKIPRDIARL